ncbi:MAG: gamma-glutamyltransferase, partial [Candidatus Limnocylindria bacterium]
APAGRIHAQAEAMKVAWAERDAHVADPEHGWIDTAWLLSDQHARSLAARLDPRRAETFEARVVAAGGTVYLAAADGEGGMVSLIESNYMGFGSGIMAGRTGIMLQNRGAYFTLEPGAANRLEPRTRPLHTLMPGMLLRNGRPWMALGAMGGDGQPQTMVQLVNTLVDDGLDAQQAVERPRWVLEVDAPGAPLRRMALEPGVASQRDVDALRERGHDIRVLERLDPVMGWAQIVSEEGDGDSPALAGGADPRADSLALGL